MSHRDTFTLIWTIILCCGRTQGSTDNCWNDDTECVVHATLYKDLKTSEDTVPADTLPLEIDCTTISTNSSEVGVTLNTQTPDYLLRRFERAYRLTLNGCHKGLKYATFGFEFLPKCDKIEEMTVERFHADTLHRIQCPSKQTFMQMEVLRFKHNEIATITADALSQLALLKKLYFVANALRHVEHNAFDGLHFISRIHLEEEPLLAIKDASLFEHTNTEDLYLIGLKQVTSALFEKLPPNLQQIHIEKTRMENDSGEALDARHADDALYINNPKLLRNVSVIDCELKVFRLKDVHASVLYLNLSGNAIVDFSIESANGTEMGAVVETLDLSDNKLSHLPIRWLKALLHLEALYLGRNLLKQLPLAQLLTATPRISVVDLRSNMLSTLTETETRLDDNALYRARLRIDDNPWNCKWLLEFAHAHPEKFRIFQYEKFLSQINVNGLECVPEETAFPAISIDGLTHSSTVNNSSLRIPFKGDKTSTPQTRLNVSTFTLVYGNPWDIKRNQRAEALIIVFMLPVGIAILFLLLYLWIYCQKVFHLSFYRKCPLFRRRRYVRSATVANRFDVVRQLPPGSRTIATNNNEGYELPLNGIAPVCNCVHSTTNSPTNTPKMTDDKCRKTHHITYVPLPIEQPEKIYEEIIGSDDDVSAANDAVEDTGHPIYDHLTFE